MNLAIWFMAAISRGISGNKTPDVPSSHSWLRYVRSVLYVLAVILVVVGIGNGGMRDVLIKAINICTECIGLGKRYQKHRTY